MRTDQEGVNEAVRRSTINKSFDRIRSGNGRGGQRDLKRERVRKSGRIETETLCSTGELNAILSLCRVLRTAGYFSELVDELEACAFDGLISESLSWALRMMADERL